jgi:general secretion pathway protein K
MERQWPIAVRAQPPRHEQGYALIAAVVSIVLFSLMALAMLNATRGSTLMVAAEADRARLQAAADAGVSFAIQGLLAREPAQRWRIDGTPKRVSFGAVTLDIRIEDERGKIALNLINQQQVARMFSEFGVQGSELERATDSFMDWRDEDFTVRAFGAERDVYAPRKIRPRNGELRTLGELALINGVGQDLARRIAPYATVNFGTGEFDPRYATPLAARVSADDEGDADLAEFGAPLREGQVIRARQAAPSDTLIGRPLTIRVEAQQGKEARARRSVIVELTGSEFRPYVIRARE